MPTRKTQTLCPNCRQPVVVEFEQLFDMYQNPDAKELLLSGSANLMQCPVCNYQGMYPTPLVYHDPEKELLLTFVPPELGLDRDSQERVVGPLITQVVNALPQEKRKAYLLQPKTMLTYQTLLETILEADGITKEVLQAQQQRMNLIQRLLNTSSEDALGEIIQQEDALIDRDFFAMYSQLLAHAAASGDERLARRMLEVQQKLTGASTFGRQVREQQQEVEAAIASLREQGGKLTREKLLELVIKAPNETRLQALVSLARGGMDYHFFQMLSDRIDRARGDGRTRLAALRDQLLEMTRQYDQHMESQVSEIRGFIQQILESDNIREALVQNAAAIDEMFINVVVSELEAAQKSGNRQRVEKLQQMIEVIQELNAPPPEVQLLNELLGIENERERQALIERLSPESVSALAEVLASVMGQVEASRDQALAAQVQEVYRQVLKHSMKMKLKT